MTMTILAFLAVLTTLIIAHEAGHLVAAKLVGIRVHEFAIGFPPRLFARRIGETLYSLNLLPLGGFVRMQGEIGPPEPGSFMSKPPLHRAAVILAGVSMNVLIAPLLFALALMVGEPTLTDRIRIQEVQPHTPAEQAGLQAGDLLLAIDGVPIRSLPQVRERIAAVPEGQAVVVSVQRGEKDLTFSVTPYFSPEANARIIGVRLLPDQVIKRYWPWEALWLGLMRTGELLGLIFVGLGMLVQGSPGTADVVGPVGIAAITGQVARTGLSQLITFTGFLSLNLAIINLIPFPGLDGARFVFTLVEMVRGRPLDPRREAIINLVGLVILFSFIMLVTYRDIARMAG